jgi:hypothetical protein
VRYLVTFILAAFFSTILLGQLEKQKGGVKVSEPTDTKAGLHLSVEVENDTLCLKDPIRFQVKLKNVSSKPITICKRLTWNGHPYFSVGIKGEGRSVPMFIIAESRWQPPLSKDDFVTIPPGESIQRKVALPLNMFDFKGPGNYQLIVWYESLATKENVP